MKLNSKILLVLIGIFLMLFSPISSQAIPFGFSNITNNDPSNVNVASQLWVDVTGSENSVTFKFYDIGDISSVITEVYFFDGALLGGTLSINSSDYVVFSQVTPPTAMPGYGGQVTSSFQADAENPAPQKGVNNYSYSNPVPPFPGGAEWLAITFTLAGTNTFQDVINDLNSGDLVIGLHVQSIGDTSKSDSFITKVPEPGILILLGIAMTAVGVATRYVRKI